jgi:hypothetical protein
MHTPRSAESRDRSFLHKQCLPKRAQTCPSSSDAAVKVSVPPQRLHHRARKAHDKFLELLESYAHPSFPPIIRCSGLRTAIGDGPALRPSGPRSSSPDPCSPPPGPPAPPPRPPPFSPQPPSPGRHGYQPRRTQLPPAKPGARGGLAGRLRGGVQVRRRLGGGCRRPRPVVLVQVHTL